MSTENFSTQLEPLTERVNRNLENPPPDRDEIEAILLQSLDDQPLDLDDLSRLALVTNGSHRDRIRQAAIAHREERAKRKLWVYPPLYIANGTAKARGCLDQCGFCMWRTGLVEPSALLNLSPEQTGEEAADLVARGYRSMELVAATVPELMDGTNVAKHVRAALQAGATHVGINFFPLKNYGEVATAGCSNVNVWQETYNPKVYRFLIPTGPKSKMGFRLDAQDRAVDAGIKTVGVAFLGGLADWRFDALMTVAHAQHLKARGANIIFGLPRMKGVKVERPPDEAKAPPEFSDSDWTFLSFLYTLAVPESWPWVSTRETLGLGMLAAEGGNCLFTVEASTAVAGYRRKDGQVQFPANSCETPKGISMLQERGFDPVMNTMPWTS